MVRRHLEVETLERLDHGDLDVRELRAAAWHLYKCRRCRARLRSVVADGERLLARLFADLAPTDVGSRKDYAAAFDAVGRNLRRCFDGAAADAGQAADRLRELLALPSGERRAAALAERRFATWKVAELLLERCAATWSDEPEVAQEFADLALALSDRMAVIPGLKADLRARAWAYTGNCRRIASDLHGSATAFERAHEWLSQGTGDVVETARILDLESSLLRARHRFGEAEKRLERACRLYLAVGDLSGVGRTLVKRAIVLGYADRAEEAVEVGRRALASIDVEKDPRLYVSAFYNMVTHLHVLGRYAEVGDLLADARQLMATHGGESGMRRLRWFEGALARDTGDPERAERLLLEVRGEYVARRAAYEAAVVSLDLVVLYLDQGHREPVRRLAQEMLSVFSSLEVQREAMAAFILFQRAAMAETLSAGVARQVLTAVRRGQSGPAPGAEGKPS